MIAIAIISAALIIALTALGFSVYLNAKLGRTIINLEDQIEESLDILDESYQHIAAVTSLPVASDDPYVRDVIASIRMARDSILLVANKLVVFGQDPRQEPDDNTDTNTDGTS